MSQLLIVVINFKIISIRIPGIEFLFHKKLTFFQLNSFSASNIAIIFSGGTSGIIL